MPLQTRFFEPLDNGTILDPCLREREAQHGLPAMLIEEGQERVRYDMTCLREVALIWLPWRGNIGHRWAGRPVNFLAQLARYHLEARRQFLMPFKTRPLEILHRDAILLIHPTNWLSKHLLATTLTVEFQESGSYPLPCFWEELGWNVFGQSERFKRIFGQPLCPHVAESDDHGHGAVLFHPGFLEVLDGELIGHNHLGNGISKQRFPTGRLIERKEWAGHNVTCSPKITGVLSAQRDRIGHRWVNRAMQQIAQLS